jgi:alkylated DNA repair dioxygenase AlkB
MLPGILITRKSWAQLPLIASLSLGAARRFDIRHKECGETHSILLENGSLVVMGGELQQYWKHQLARTMRPVEERINLTFRYVSVYPMRS